MIAQPHCPHRAAFRIHGRIDKFYCQACWWAPHNRPTRRPSRVTRCTDQVWHQCDGRPQPRDGHGEAQP
jgi:NAD-dependent SIR2 family protein deacetylase